MKEGETQFHISRARKGQMLEQPVREQQELM